MSESRVLLEGRGVDCRIEKDRNLRCAERLVLQHAAANPQHEGYPLSVVLSGGAAVEVDLGYLDVGQLGRSQRLGIDQLRDHGGVGAQRLSRTSERHLGLAEGHHKIEQVLVRVELRLESAGKPHVSHRKHPRAPRRGALALPVVAVVDVVHRQAQNSAVEIVEPVGTAGSGPRHNRLRIPRAAQPRILYIAHRFRCGAHGHSVRIAGCGGKQPGGSRRTLGRKVQPRARIARVEANNRGVLKYAQLRIDLSSAARTGGRNRGV